MFHKISAECYAWLKNQPFVKEESITDWLLYTISAHNPYIYYKAFSRNEEAFNGSDWEWWIVIGKKHETKAYRLLAQAKKLKAHKDNYPLITYSNKKGLQIDLLIQEALRRNAFPLYSYYTCCNPKIENQLKNIDYIPPELLKWCEGCINGCFLTSAFSLQQKIFDVPRRKIPEEELVDSSFGISILDKGFYDLELLYNMLNQLNRNFLNFHSNEQIAQLGIIYEYCNLPQYVKTLIERHSHDDLLWYEKEFRHSLDNLSGIVIVDTREICKKE